MMPTWLRSLANAFLGKVSGKTSRLDTATRMMIDADFSLDRERPREPRPADIRTPVTSAVLRIRSRMRYLLAAAFVCLGWHASSALAYRCDDHHYVNSSGDVAHSPSCGEEREKRAAECRDGSVSFSEHHRGTCSYHGGVAHWD
jgi:hypothetical protein